MEAKGGTAAVTRELMTSQVRRIHVIYFLSRMGRIEHPHLIRVHHLSRNGVYLRDVKRWLSDLRGKDMPDSFSWSYKRKYKAGYVWQDLVDEDLITPISDNEYVLKGSEISSIPLDACSCGGKKASTENPEPVEDKLQQPLSEKIPENPYKTSEIEIEIDKESSEPLESETSTITDDSMKSNASKPKKRDKEENNSEKKNKKSTEKTKPPLTSSATFTKSKSYSTGASQVFRSLLNCGTVDTNDSAMMIMTRVQRSCKNPASEDSSCNQQPDQQNSRKSFSGMKTSKNTDEKKVSDASKPAAEPICSQCGKGFKPEKLHSHMKSCKGMKSLSKTGGGSGGVGGGGGGAADTTAPEKTSSWRSTDASSKELSTYFLQKFF